MNPLRQRLLALAILAVVIALAWLGVVSPIADAFAAQDEDIARSHQMLAQFESRVAMRPLVEAKLDELKRDEASSAGLIGGASAELAAANMQNLMKTLIESESGQVHSTQNLPPVTADGFQRIDIQYDMSVPMTRLKDIAYRIETNTPYLFLDSVDLRAPENWGNLVPGVPVDPPNVEVRWVVHGYRWVGAP